MLPQSFFLSPSKNYFNEHNTVQWFLVKITAAAAAITIEAIEFAPSEATIISSI